jgi:outer membrane protein OmpA-like peptidoglycan-associated protein
MKKLLLVILSVIFFQPSFSQTAEKKWAIGLGAGVYGNLETDGIGFMPELYLSRFLSPSFDLRLQQDLGLFNSEVKSSLDVANYFLNLRYKFNNGKILSETSFLQPYLYAGPGYLFDNKTDGLNFDAGVGTKFKLSPSTALFIEGGYIDGIEYTKNNDNIKENLWKVVGGIEISLGKSKDSDGDGVKDSKDQCPDTPAGVVVDAKGCPVDTDGDGIADYKDDCPTEAGLLALNGCPDRDGDGVADKDDLCPDTPGLPKLKGCPDSDGDGVADKDDQCPDTPAGWKVDAKGCPVDTDGDGIVDGEDECPTVPGTKANKGCPEKETGPAMIDMKFENVHFASDKSYLTDYSKGRADKVIAVLKENPGYKVKIYGHTDSRESEDYNMRLSQRRIDSVVKYLASKGITEARILETKAFGESKPIATNDTAEGRAKNRRVEFEVYK